jgi:hypothetical protein
MPLEWYRRPKLRKPARQGGAGTARRAFATGVSIMLMLGGQTTMKSGTDIDKSGLLKAMTACVENGLRLHQDAQSLDMDRSPTVLGLCILAQEEFAKAFLLHLVREGVISWTARVRESLHSHAHKQLMGLIMEWLSPSDDEFTARINVSPL